MLGESFRYAARGRDHEHIHISIVFSSEGDVSPVGREYRIAFRANSAGQANGITTSARNAPEVVGIREYDVGLFRVGCCRSNGSSPAAQQSAAKKRKRVVRRMDTPNAVRPF